MSIAPVSLKTAPIEVSAAYSPVKINSILSTADFTDLSPAGTIVRIKYANGDISCAVKLDTFLDDDYTPLMLWSVAGIGNVTSSQLLSLGTIIVSWTPQD